MRRREFITLLGGVAAWPIAARAQQPDRMRLIGVLMAYAENDSTAQSWLAAFRAALAKLGWTEGSNLRIELRWSAADADATRTLAKELVDLRPNAIFGVTTPAIGALARETRTIPIVFAGVSDPIGGGFVANLAHPGGNITGFMTIRSPYVGQNSLIPNQGREGWDIMYFAGVRLWQGAEFWIDPEIDQGFGLSNTEGVAGFPTGVSFRVGASVPYARIQRAFVRQTIDFGGGTQKVEADQNQFAGSNTLDRLVITIGKFSLSDVFDQNKYAQNPRKDFMNWALIDTGSFDYAADAWGYTYGMAAEWYQGNWTLRGGLAAAPREPNSTDIDTTFQQFQWLGEVERRYELWSHPGKIALTGFITRARLGSFQDAIQLAQMIGGPADIAAVRQYRSRSGLGVNFEQEITSDLGVFAHAGFVSGNVETDSYTDVDSALAAGLSLKGKQWGRSDDTFGFAGIVNGISKARQQFLNAGGLGILVGDGRLPHPGLEQILETYYEFPLFATKVTFDYQFIVNPAYNRDRGPVSVIGARVQAEF